MKKVNNNIRMVGFIALIAIYVLLTILQGGNGRGSGGG